MVLHSRNYDVIASYYMVGSPGLSYKIDPGGSTTGENNFLRVGPNKSCYSCTSLFISTGCRLTRAIDPTAHGSIVTSIKITQRVQHHLWLMACSSAIQVNRRCVQCGKIRSTIHSHRV